MSKLGTERRTCAMCGRGYTVKRISYQVTCSKLCRNKLTQRDAREQMTAIQIEQAMLAMVRNETAMPWDRS